MIYPKIIEDLIEKLCQLPGVGRRSAERMIYWMLSRSKDQCFALAENITQLKKHLRFCKKCHNLAEEELCRICQDTERNSDLICIVENPKDLIAIEKSGSYKGYYHVLLGTISPAEGRGPEYLRLTELKDRIKTDGVKEIIIATDPDTDGEMTALHISKELTDLPVKVTRIGLGIPVGSSVEYADLSTLNLSLSSRREILQQEKGN